MIVRKIILTDCDGVLLDWNTSFNEYMFDQYSIEVATGCSPIEQDLEKRFGCKLPEGCVAEFNNSHRLSTLKPFNDALEAVNLLTRSGYRFVCITACSNPAARKEQLERLFGNNVFEKIICVLDIQSKEGALIDTYNKYGSCAWVEDNEAACTLGVQIGHKGFLIGRESWLDVCKFANI